MKKLIPLCLLALIVAPASAQFLGGNFCSKAPIVDYPAGLAGPGTWNDYTAPNGYFAAGTVIGGTDLDFSDGTPAPGTTAISWDTPNGGSQNTNDSIARPVSPNTTGNDIQDGHDQMFAGYLQATRLSPNTPLITLSGEGLNDAFDSSYDLYLYLDGDTDVQPDNDSANNQFKVSIYSTSTKAVPLASAVFGRDADDFPVIHTVAGDLSDYVQITSTVDGSPTEGHYVLFEGLTSDTFFVEIEGVIAGSANNLNDGGHGVAMNGFQIVPEPTTLGLLGIGAIAMIRRRR